MSVRKLTTKIAMLLVLVTGGMDANGKEPVLPPADPFAFDPDYRWFEPIYEADLLDIKPKKRAHTGWYATYDKLNLYGKRPDSYNGDGVEDDYKLDGGEGHRYDLGYMRPDSDTGLLFSYSELDVNAVDGFRVDRINRLNSENLDGEPEFALGPTRFGLPVFPEDGNVFGLSRRVYDVGESLNNMEYHSYELNKTWRMEPYHYGGILEPMVGVRHISAEDMGFRRVYSRTREDELPIGFGNSIYFNDLGVNVEAVERLTETIADIDNDIYTMQLGFRYFKFQNRFRYSAEFRTFAGLNLQCLKQYTRESITVYDGFDFGSEVVQNTSTTSAAEIHRNEEFFIGYDIRAELGYQLTSMVHIRGGIQLIDLALGLWRNDRSFDFNSQDENIDGYENREQSFLAVGYTFGIELNR